jgi:subtilase family serine protease
MLRQTRMLLFLGALTLAAFVMVGCQTKPDLLPITTPEGIVPEYCDHPPGPELGLRVTVHNAGLSDAPASSTAVIIEGVKLIRPTDPIPAGGDTVVDFYDLPVLPAGDWYFTIEVDAKEDIVEADESNNTVKSYCIG